MSISEITDAGQFTLGTPLTFVSFARQQTATRITPEHVPQLISGFADFGDLTSWSEGALSPAQEALVPQLSGRAPYVEIKGLRNALRIFGDSLEPVLGVPKCPQNSTSFCTLEIVLMLQRLKERLDNGPLVIPTGQEQPRSAIANLKILTNGISGPGSVIDDGWTLTHASRQELMERQRKLTAAKRAVRSASRKSLLATLLAHGCEESAKLGLDNKAVGDLRFAYLELLDKEIEKHAVPSTPPPPRRCSYLSCATQCGLEHIQEGTVLDVHLCSTHFGEVKGRVLASNPAWTVGKRDFRLAVGRLLNHLAKANLRCQVCAVPVPSWNLKAAYCVCTGHAKQLLTWCREKSWLDDMDFSHVDIDSFAPRGIEALKASWERTCARCACCGMDNEDAGCILTFGHDEQRAPNGTRAMCGSCREYIDGYLRANSPQKMCGRGSTVTAMQEWLEVLRLGHTIGNGKLKTKGWMPGSVVVRAEDEHTQAKDFFLRKGT